MSDTTDPYEQHFGCNSVHLSEAARLSVDERAWNLQKSSRGRLGPTHESIPEGCDPGPSIMKGDAVSLCFRLIFHAPTGFPRSSIGSRNRRMPEKVYRKVGLLVFGLLNCT